MSEYKEDLKVIMKKYDELNEVDKRTLFKLTVGALGILVFDELYIFLTKGKMNDETSNSSE